MSFEELYETLLNAAKKSGSFALNMVKTLKETYQAIYEHGAESRQAEIDELQKRIDEALFWVNDNCCHEICYMIKEILKGKQHEN